MNFKKLLPALGAAAGYAIAGPAGSQIIGAALGSGIGTLFAGGSPEDAMKNALLSGATGGVAKSAGLQFGSIGAQKATEEVAKQKVAEEATKKVAEETAKKGIQSLLTPGNIALGSMALGALAPQPKMPSSKIDPKELESAPDYEGQILGGLFVDPETGKTYDTVDELMDAIEERKNTMTKKAEGGIIAFAPGGFIEGPGTGTSDDIKAGIYQNGKKVQEARLSDEEFVFTKKAVKGAGNGDTEKGAKEMYDLMAKFERMA